MSQVITIASSLEYYKYHSKTDNRKILMPGGTTISYIGSIINGFLNKEVTSIKYKYEWDGRVNEVEFLDRVKYFAEGGASLGVERLSKQQFMLVYSALEDGYNYLKNLSLEERNKWIAENTIYGHVEDLWNHNTWGTYKNYRGEERNNNMKNVLEDVLDMMRLDDRYDEELIIED